MSNVVNFSNLKRKEIRALIYTDNGEVKVEYGQEKINNLQKQLENCVLIYNPNNKQRKEMENIIGEIGKKSLKDNKIDVIIEAKDLILKFLPLCSNVILDLDEKEDIELIKEIIKDPSDEFNAIISEVTKIVKVVSENYIKTIKAFTELPKEQLEKILNESLQQETPEEKELRELKERQKELEDKLNKKNEE